VRGLARTPWAPGAPALAAAARVVDAVATRGHSADVALAVPPEPAAAPAAVRAIALGTLRWYLRLVPALESLLEHPTRLPRPVHALLATAAHQIVYSRNAPEATVHAAVDAARLLGASRVTGLVNAVLRRLNAGRGSLFTRVDAALPGRTAHPEWLVQRILEVWGTRTERVLTADNAHPPMTLRVDLTRRARADYASELAAASIDAIEIQWIDSALTLSHPMDISRVPGFVEGVVSVQDAGAQLASRLLGVGPGMRVLDACAAPGGKTGQLLELLDGTGEVTAVDADSERVGLIGENLNRLRRAARVCVGDARDPASFWDGRPYDRILVDAPCSSTGVIRRHPDIKLLRRPADIAAFATTQLAVLRGVWPLLAPGGRLLYSTCSILPEENEEIVAAAMRGEPGMTERTLPLTAAPGAVGRAFGLQLLPGAEAGTDGFYYACLEKTTAGT